MKYARINRNAQHDFSKKILPPGQEKSNLAFCYIFEPLRKSEPKIGIDRMVGNFTAIH